ncbi:MAG: FadR family transcriptional regulator [Anaerolineae bacterium]|nr:FadR family transcriptional regulator [Anaerolineae bacterium]
MPNLPNTDDPLAKDAPVHQWVFDTLKQQIQHGEWLPGEKMPSIAQLSKHLKAGTGSVREALRSLQSLGMVSIEHGRGIFVSQNLPLEGAKFPAKEFQSFQEMGAGTILALCEARRILEPELAAFAAERSTPEEQSEITRLANDMSERAAQGADFLAPDLQFHRKIAEAAHNPVLKQMMDSVADLLTESRTYTMRPTVTPRAVRYHLMIAEAIQERDAPQARLLMLAHVNDAIQSVINRKND